MRAMASVEEGSVEDWLQDADGGFRDPQVWDRQGAPLTVEQLRMALNDLSPTMEVDVTVFDGASRRAFQPVDITVDHQASPPRLTLTVSQVDVG